MKERLKRYAGELAMFVPRGDPATWQIAEEVRSKPTCVNLNLPPPVLSETSRKRRHAQSPTASMHERCYAVYTPLLRAAHIRSQLAHHDSVSAISVVRAYHAKGARDGYRYAIQ